MVTISDFNFRGSDGGLSAPGFIFLPKSFPANDIPVLIRGFGVFGNPLFAKSSLTDPFKPARYVC